MSAAAFGLAALLTLGTTMGSTGVAASDSGCTAAPTASTAGGDAQTWLARGAAAAYGGVRHPLRLRAVSATSQNYQSDRMYPPYLFYMQDGESWYDPASGVMRTQGDWVMPFGVRPARGAVLATATATYATKGDSLLPQPAAHVWTLRGRPLDAWAVLHDWSASADVRVVGRCHYRDYQRLVLGRTGPYGAERLYLSELSGLPVKLERREPDDLWGELRVEYLYTNWVQVDGGQYAMASYRIVDGEPEVIRTATALPATDSIPRLALPDGAPDMTAAALAPRPDAEPDTVRVGPHTVLLRTPMYTNVVTLQRDTVFIFDAQYSGDLRAARDSAWIAKLFPGRHPVVLVVSDLAWPHVQGVRFWVARGATVVSHAASRTFLERVVARRWTARPDALERARTQRPGAAGVVRFRFRPVTDSLRLAGGAVVAHAIDGIGSEGALMTWLPGDRFLYAGDYIQTAQQPTAYAGEVRAAARRVGIVPERTAAMHLPLTPWSTVEALFAAAR